MNSFLILKIFLTLSLSHARCMILDTRQGTLKGEVLQSRGGRPFYAFYGIPYAEPPVGERRFKNPVPPKPWGGIRDATVLPPACPWRVDDGKIFGQEDCLYLNLYTPKISNDSLLPVMVFIYGGRYMYGDASPSRYGAHYFMDKDMILITFHYRLGALGFISTEDEALPGNYGLKDEVAVLEWIQQYIDSFGGDKGRVTVAGGSSGGASASLLLISPIAEGLFHRVIAHSGYPVSVKKPGTARKAAWKFASYVGCDGDDVISSEDLMKCLRKVSPEELVKYNRVLYTFGCAEPIFPFGPVIENEKVPGAFLVDDPRILLQRNSNIPLILGVTGDDGGMMAIFNFFKESTRVIDDIVKDPYTNLPKIFNIRGFVNSTEHSRYIIDMYKDHFFGDTDLKNVHAFVKMLTCILYFEPLLESVNAYKGPTYLFLYAHRNEQTFAHTYADFEEDLGVIHGDELISFFNWSEAITPITKGVDLAVSEQMIELYSNFAATGNPNRNGPVIWEPTKSKDLDYLHIENGEFKMRRGLLTPQCDVVRKVPLS